jgi:shikimate kinase
MAVVLVGFMGAGKTTVGRILAKRLRQPFLDSDQYLERTLGRTVRDVFAVEGEAYFRELEHQAVLDLLRGPESVIALGGGAVADARTRDALGSAQVVYLRVSYAASMARLHGDAYRPMLLRPELDQVYLERLPLYEQLAVVTLDTDSKSPQEIAAEVLNALSA